MDRCCDDSWLKTMPTYEYVIYDNNCTINLFGDIITKIIVHADRAVIADINIHIASIELLDNIKLRNGYNFLPFFGRKQPLPARLIRNFCMTININTDADIKIIVCWYFVRHQLNNIISYNGNHWHIIDGNIIEITDPNMVIFRLIRAKNAIRRQLPDMLRHLYQPDGPMLQRFVTADFKN